MVDEAISRCVRRAGIRLCAATLAALVLLPASAGAADWSSRPVPIDGLTVPARATATGVELSQARVLEVGFWEPTGALWAASDGIAPALPWQPARMLISHPLRRPDTGQQIPARTDARTPHSDARRRGSDRHLPWMLLGFADPSSHATRRHERQLIARPRGTRGNAVRAGSW